jgi:hypothetical protein
MRSFASWAGIVLGAAFLVASAILDTPEAESRLGVQLANSWVIVAGAILFVIAVFFKVFDLQADLIRLRRTQPKLSVELPEAVTFELLDSPDFQVAVSNAPNFASAVQAKVFVQATDPPQLNVRFPAQLQQWSRNIGPDETTHYRVLQKQHGASGGNPTCTLWSLVESGGAFHLDLIHGSDRLLISYRVTANNLARGIDFHCSVKRSAPDGANFQWETTWGFGLRPKD